MNLESAPSLTMATKIGDLSLIKLLVEMGAYYSTASGKSNLLYLSVPNLELMEFFLKLGIDINGNESDGVPLIKAIRGMNFEAVKFLVDHKAELNQEFFFGSPLKQASECSDGHARDQYCSVENLLIINYLIKHGGSLNIDESNSPLLAAVGRLDLSMVKNFLALGANVNWQSSYFEYSIGHFFINHIDASYYTDLKIFRGVFDTLIEAGLNLNLKNSSHEEPLCLAQRKDLREYLILKGAVCTNDEAN